MIVIPAKAGISFFQEGDARSETGMTAKKLRHEPQFFLHRGCYPLYITYSSASRGFR